MAIIHYFARHISRIQNNRELSNANE